MKNKWNLGNPNYVFLKYLWYCIKTPLLITFGIIYKFMPSFVVLTAGLVVFHPSHTAMFPEMINYFTEVIRFMLAITYTISGILLILYTLYAYEIITEERCPILWFIVSTTEALVVVFTASKKYAKPKKSRFRRNKGSSQEM